MKAKNKEHVGRKKGKGKSARKGQSAQLGGKGKRVKKDFRAEKRKAMKTRGSSGVNAKTSREELRNVSGDFQRKENEPRNLETFENQNPAVVETSVETDYSNRKEKSPIEVRDDTTQKATERGFEV